MTEGILDNILILLAASVVAVALFGRLRLPPILGYLTVGILVGPHVLAWIPHSEGSHFMAELGIVFLMFMVGLEFSLPSLFAAKGAILGLGGAQVALTTLLAGLISYAAGFPPPVSLVLGGAVAMSSTAVVLKQLAEQRELTMRHGRMVVGILLFQDLATLPFLAVLPTLAHGDGLSAALALALLKAIGVFTILLLLGRWIIRPIMYWVASAHSEEIFMLATLLMILGAAATARVAGLSLPLGAFLAGVVAGETEFRHQVEADIRPFQDILLGLFFITIGMQLDPMTLWHQGVLVGLLLSAIIVAKMLLVILLGLAAGHDRGEALRAGITLAHVGEFGLLLVSLALQYHLLSQPEGQVVLASMVLSMALAPLLIRFNSTLVQHLEHIGYVGILSRPEDPIVATAKGLKGHVIIGGYGRIGQSLARLLEQEHLDYIALDLDPERVRQARSAGERVVYGDTTRASLLHAAGLDQARALVLSFDEPQSAFRVLSYVRRQRADLPILVRTRSDRDLEELLAAGATDVLPESLEATLMLGAQLLLHLGIPLSQVEERLGEIRGDQYRLLRNVLRDFEPRRLQSAYSTGKDSQLLHAITLSQGAYAIGHTLHELDLAAMGVTLVAVRRGGIRVPEPTLDTRFRQGDTIILDGPTPALQQARKLLLGRG